MFVINVVLCYLHLKKYKKYQDNQFNKFIKNLQYVQDVDQMIVVLLEYHML
jgi:hypothetical protein